MANEYITTDDLTKYGINAAALEGVSQDDIDTVIAAASSEADCYLSGVYTTPLTTYPIALKMHVAKAAVYHLLGVIGFDPNGSDEIIVKNYERAIAFYKDLQKRQQSLPAAETAPEEDDIGAVVSSAPMRGW